jgi:hypothetical protein
MVADEMRMTAPFQPMTPAFLNMTAPFQDMTLNKIHIPFKKHYIFLPFQPITNNYFPSLWLLQLHLQPFKN